MAVRDWKALQRTVTAGGEAQIVWVLDPAVALDALDLVVVNRNGQELDLEDGVTVAPDGTTITYVPPEDMPVQAGEVFRGRYMYLSLAPTLPGDADKASILDAAASLVRSPEALSVTEADISVPSLLLACEGSYYDLLKRFAAQIPSVAALGATDSGTGSDVYHFARAVGFLAAARLIGGIQAGRTGSFQLRNTTEADDARESSFAALAVSAADLMKRAERELSLVAAIEESRSAAAASFPLFGVRGPRRRRQALTPSQAWAEVLHELLGTASPLPEVMAAAAPEDTGVRHTYPGVITAGSLIVTATVYTPIPVGQRILGFSSRGNLDPLLIGADDSRTTIRYEFPAGTDPALDPDLDWVTFAY